MKLIANCTLHTKAGVVAPGGDVDIKDKAEIERLLAIGAVRLPTSPVQTSAPVADSADPSRAE